MDARSAVRNLRTLAELRDHKSREVFSGSTFRSAPTLPTCLHGAIDWARLAELLGVDADTARMRVRIALGTLIAVARCNEDATAELAFAAADRAAEHVEAERAALREIQTGTIQWPEERGGR